MNRNHPYSRSRGFTLVEMMIVIGIIAVLISLLLPTLSRARGSAKLAQCANNLHQFYTSAEGYRQKNSLSGPPSIMAGAVWTSAVMQMGCPNSMLLCPEEDLGNAGSAKTLGLQADFLNHTVAAHAHIQDTGYDVPLAPLPFQQGFAILGDDPSWPNAPGSADHATTATDFTISIEDQGAASGGGGDWSYENAVFRVHNNGDGTGTITVLSRYGSYKVDLVDDQTGKNIFTAVVNGGDGIGATSTVGVSGITNYAFNINCNDTGIYGRADKVLGIDYDYSQVVSPATDDWSNPNFQVSYPPQYIFARHNNKINVLWGDGHVEPTQVNPLNRTLDPAVQANRDQYWSP